MTTINQISKPGSVESDRDTAGSEHSGGLREDFKTLKTDVAHAGVEIAHDAKMVATDVKDAVVETATEYGDQAAEYHATMCRTVRKYPTTAVLVSLGAGILLGRLLGGR